MVAAADTTSPEVMTYLRRRTGIAPAREGVPVWRRILGSRWTFLTATVLILSVISMLIMIPELMATKTAEDGTSYPGLNADALRLCAGRAFPTLAFWLICFILVDRYKPQRAIAWFLALAWGGCVAICSSYYINSWAGEQMAVFGQVSGTTGIRTAVFIAPFVEEGTKACIIFFIAVVDRNRFTSRVSGAVIGGLAGAAFAFFENIVYYARLVVYGSYTAGTGDVMAALDELVFLRGVLTCFGHPLFTLMTGVGVAFAVAARSKIVRVLAPAAGFLAAAFLHMFFNFQVSALPTESVPTMIIIIAWPIVIVVALRVVITSVRQGRLVAARLTDFVAMGWLPSNYPVALSKVRRRLWTLLISPWHGNLVRTWKLQVRATELAMLREAMTRGTIDSGGLLRERELIDELAELARRKGLVDGKGLRPYWPWNTRQPGRVVRVPLPRWSPPQGLPASVPVRYAAVDPSWGPPA